MYKFSDETGRAVECEGAANITPGNSRMWSKYQAWLAQGNTTEPFESEPTIDDQLAEIAAQRYVMETEDFEYEGVTYSMSREDRNVMFQTVSYILSGVVSSVRWKAKSGWITLDATNAQAIQAAIIAKVQSAFVWEEEQQELIGNE